MKVSSTGIDVIELTDSKRLYILELAITKRSWAPNASNPVLYRVPLIIFGRAEWSKDGKWGTSYFGASILGFSGGFWRIGKRGRDGFYTIVLYIKEPPDLVTGLWKDYPESCGLIDKIPEYPLTIGAVGRGGMNVPQNESQTRWLTWKVTDRSF